MTGPLHLILSLGWRAARRYARGLRRDTRGAAAVEFGMVAMPFLALFCAIIEMSIWVVSQMVLDIAVADASRLILTGQAQKLGLTDVDFHKAVCTRVVAILDCTNGVKVDVQVAKSWTAPPPPVPDAKGDFPGPYTWVPGVAGDIVFVRAVYSMTTIFSNFGYMASDIAPGRRLIQAVVAFRNEPFEL